MQVVDDNAALTLRNGRLSLRLMFSTATRATPGVGYWILPLCDGVPMFPDHWFRRLDHEIAAGQPAGSIFADDQRCALGWRLRDAMHGGQASRWQSDSGDVSALCVPGGAGLPNLSDRTTLADGHFDVIFAFHTAKTGEARWNNHDAGPCLRMTVPRAMLEIFCDALAAGVRARVPPDRYDE